jgi:hypothetical protein
MLERVLSWALSLTLAVLLLTVVLLQMTGPMPNPIFGIIAARSHIGLFEPWGRYFVALAEVAAIVLTVNPSTRSKGAVLAAVVALAAIVLHLSPWLGIDVAQGAAVSQALAQGHSASAIAALDLPTDKGALFMLSLALAVLAGAIVFVEQAKLKALTTPKVRKPVGAFA